MLTWSRADLVILIYIYKTITNQFLELWTLIKKIVGTPAFIIYLSLY